MEPVGTAPRLAKMLVSDTMDMGEDYMDGVEEDDAASPTSDEAFGDDLSSSADWTVRPMERRHCQLARAEEEGRGG